MCIYGAIYKGAVNDAEEGAGSGKRSKSPLHVMSAHI